jgi:integrase
VAASVGIKTRGRPFVVCHYRRWQGLCDALLLEKPDPKIVQEMLGHANISETMDTYSHVLPSMQETAVSAIEDALS